MQWVKGSSVAAAKVQVCSCGLDSVPGSGTSICCGCRYKKKKKKKRPFPHQDLKKCICPVLKNYSGCFIVILLHSSFMIFLEFSYYRISLQTVCLAFCVFCFVLFFVFFQSFTLGVWKFPAAAAGLHHSHGNARSEPCPQPSAALGKFRSLTH